MSTEKGQGMFTNTSDLTQCDDPLIAMAVRLARPGLYEMYSLSE